MTHPSEENLTLHYYGETENAREITAHLEECAGCREDYALIQRTLNAVDGLAVPGRGAGYGEEVWRKVAPRLGLRRRWLPEWFHPKTAAVAALACAVVVVGLMVGRWQGGGAQPREVARDRAAMEERLLLANLAEHLERSQVTLIELAHGAEGDLREGQSRAEDLLASSRLYRQSARMSGQAEVEEMLDELEQLLAEVANAGPGELSRIKQRMVERDILFKLRVIDSQMRERQRKTLATSSN